MKIKRLRLTNFRCFNSLEIGFEEQLTVLVAPNGGGKSAILDALALGLGPFLTRIPKISGINPKDTDYRLLPDGKKPPYMHIDLETYEGISWDRVVRRDKSVGIRRRLKDQKGLGELNHYVDGLLNDFINGNNPRFPIIAYYGTGRGVFDTPQRRRGFQKDFSINDSYRNALEAKANFKQFFEYFYFLEDLERREKEERRDWDYQNPLLLTIREAISRIMPDFTNPRSALRPLRFLIDWNQYREKQPLRIEQLSDGYRTTLAMVMDIAARMAEANPSSNNILDSEGIVLIDEVDLHLHPKWQQMILPDLIRTFPNVQFIVSTHSPQVLTTVESKKIRVLHQTVQGQSDVMCPTPEVKGIESAVVLNDVMGVNPVPPVEEARWIADYTAKIENGTHEDTEGQALRKKLLALYGPNHPVILDSDKLIRFQSFKLRKSKATRDKV